MKKTELITLAKALADAGQYGRHLFPTGKDWKRGVKQTIDSITDDLPDELPDGLDELSDDPVSISDLLFRGHRWASEAFAAGDLCVSLNSLAEVAITFNSAARAHELFWNFCDSGEAHILKCQRRAGLNEAGFWLIVASKQLRGIA